MRTFLLLLLCAVPLAAQDAAAMLDEGDKLFAERKFAEARDRYEACAKAAADAGATETQSEATAQVARMYSLLQDFDNGRKWLETAKALAKPEQKLGWSRYLGVRGRFEWQDEKDNPKATKTFVEMYEYCMKQSLHSRALDAAHMVAITGEPKQKREWSLKAVAAAEKAGEKGWLATLWNNLGWDYDETGEVEKAFVALLKARKYHHEVGNDHSKLVADFAVAHAYRRVGMLQEAREWLTEAFNKAKARYDENPKDKDRIEWLGWGHKYFGDLLMDEGNSEDAALTRYKQALPLLEEAGLQEWWQEQHTELKAKIEKLSKENRESPKRE